MSSGEFVTPVAIRTVAQANTRLESDSATVVGLPGTLASGPKHRTSDMITEGQPRLQWENEGGEFIQSEDILAMHTGLAGGRPPSTDNRLPAADSAISARAVLVALPRWDRQTTLSRTASSGLMCGSSS